MARTKPSEQPQTSSAQQIGAVTKSCRDIMRKDKGLNGDLDRLPVLTWVMFLKFLDDMEQVREAEAALGDAPFRPSIEPPYRWRDWASNPGGITGDELVAFINQDEAVRPDQTRGRGLFAYLRSLQSANGDDRRDVIANVFRGVVNRMTNGYLLRDVVNKVDSINFRASDDVHTLSLLYESMLREVRDAAGDSGEFYTPRPVVKFIVTVLEPKLGETILDPAAGTGGFLAAAFEHLEAECRTVDEREYLQRDALRGIEAKSLPYLLCQVNLLLHGLEYPAIDPGNALRFPLREIGDSDRVDIVMTNPPFGGEEEPGILGNFPDDRRTAETALLFLQLIMRRLRRPVGGHSAGRCGMVVPNGTLFGDGVCARIKEELLKDFNLHTIVRLPAGVFAPYTDIETNVLFFDRTGPTSEIWYYQQPLPEGRRKYTKTQPLQYEELQPLLAWWTNRCPTDNAWTVSPAEILKYDDGGGLQAANLDIKNPNTVETAPTVPPQQLVRSIVDVDNQVSTLANEIQDLVASFQQVHLSTAPEVRMGDLATLVKRPVENLSGIVRSLGVKWWGKGCHVAEEKPAEELRAARFAVQSDDLIYNDMWARHGSVAIVPTYLSDCVASAHFPTWELDLARVYPPYFSWCFKSPWFWAACEARSQGSTGRNAISKTQFRELVMPLPSLEEQRELNAVLDQLRSSADQLRRLQQQASSAVDSLLPSILNAAFRGEL